MDKIKPKNTAGEIYKRSYYGSLVLLTLFFLLFIFKTSSCSPVSGDLEAYVNNSADCSNLSDSNENISIGNNKIQDSISNNNTKKNIIKELTVNKKLVNINTASVEELTELKGIGKTTALKIVKYRNEAGGFKSAEELMKVKGIGKKKFSVIKDNIILK